VATAPLTDLPSTDGAGPITAARSARQLLQLLADARSDTEPRRLRPATPATSLSPASATPSAALAALRAFAAWFLSPDPDDASSHGCAMAWVPAQQDGLYGAWPLCAHVPPPPHASGHCLGYSVGLREGPDTAVMAEQWQCIARMYDHDPAVLAAIDTTTHSINMDLHPAQVGGEAVDMDADPPRLTLPALWRLENDQGLPLHYLKFDCAGCEWDVAFQLAHDVGAHALSGVSMVLARLNLTAAWERPPLSWAYAETLDGDGKGGNGLGRLNRDTVAADRLAALTSLLPADTWALYWRRVHPELDPPSLLLTSLWQAVRAELGGQVAAWVEPSSGLVAAIDAATGLYPSAAAEHVTAAPASAAGQGDEDEVGDGMTGWKALVASGTVAGVWDAAWVRRAAVLTAEHERMLAEWVRG